MKAQAFFDLVGKMMQTQGDYYQAKRDGLIKARDLLIASKSLEKQVRAVLKEGHLEPDEPTAEINISDEEYQERLFSTDEERGRYETHHD